MSDIIKDNEIIENEDEYNFSMYPELTKKQKLFLKYYLETFDAVESARSAGYSVSSENVLQSMASQLLKNKKILEVINDFVSEEIKNNRFIFKNRTLKNLIEMCFFDPFEIVNEFGELKKNPSELFKTQKACIQQIKSKFDKNNIKSSEIIFVEKIKAIEQLSKILGFYDDVEEKNIVTNETMKNLMDKLQGK